MRTITFTYNLAMLFVLTALTACGRNGAGPKVASFTATLDTPTESIPTPTRSATRTPITPGVTPTTSPIPQPDWGTTPAAPVDAYRLSTFSDDTAWTLLQSEEDLVFPDDPERLMDGDWTVVRLALLHELAAAEPGASHRDDAKRLLARPESYGWQAPAPVEPARALIEQALNSVGAVSFTPKTLSELIAAALQSSEIKVLDVLVADNVLADGAPGWILVMRDGYEIAATLVVSGRPGSYNVVSPRSEWERFAWSDQSVSAPDWNRNGVPEVALTDRRWGTGITHYCGETLSLYEWDGAGFSNLTPGLVLDVNTDSGDCIGFSPEDPATTAPIVLQGGYWIDTGCRPAEDELPVGPRWLRRYSWNGETFALVGESFAPLSDPLVGAAAWPACLLSWVNEAGPDNDQAYALLPLILSDTDPVRTAHAIEQFGPAYVDFFRFKLGVWHALRGRSMEAQAILTEVRDMPVTPAYTMAARLAAAFLEGYQVRGAYSGCVATSSVLTFDAYLNPPVADYPYDVEAMRADWGFADWQWVVGTGSVWSGPGLRGDVLNLCGLVSAFRRTLSQQMIADTDGLMRWLATQAIPVTGLQEADLDLDGRRDWLGFIGTGDNQTWHLWVILNRADGPRPLWVADVFRQTGNIPTAWGVFQPAAGVEPIHIFQWTDGQVLFRVPAQSDPTGVEVLHRSIGYFDGENPLGFVVEPVEDTSTDGAARLKIVTVGAHSWEPTWYVLDWVERANAVQEVDSPLRRQDRLVAQAEALLFDQQYPAKSATILDTLLAEGGAVIDVNAARGWAAPTTRPYLLYLQGLAHARAGHAARAVETYWTLWNDYPLHPLAYIAALRLELRDP